MFSFGNDFAGPWDLFKSLSVVYCSRPKFFLCHCISFRCKIQCDRQGEKCFTRYNGRCGKMSKKLAKKLDTLVCYFCQ